MTEAKQKRRLEAFAQRMMCDGGLKVLDLLTRSLAGMDKKALISVEEFSVAIEMARRAVEAKSREFEPPNGS